MTKILLVVSNLLFSSALFANEYCYGRICLDDDYIVHHLDKEAYDLIEKQISLKEKPDMPFETIQVSAVEISGPLYILKMRKPHYYGSQALIIREHESKEWKILYEIDFIE